ncbi:hypothetical protein [Acetivibrio straminisolvens]|jgi:hypothetical protein|nr:hypothetical protein [Acetivibrio straminisolvens]
MLMIKVVCGKKGVGKTRTLVDSANSFVSTALGDAVFIDGSSQLMYDLNHKVRFINVSEFPMDISSSCTFLGFICGIISGNFDIKWVYIDDLIRIVRKLPDEMKELFEGFNDISEKFNVDFYVSIEGDPDSMPEFIKECY